MPRTRYATRCIMTRAKIECEPLQSPCGSSCTPMATSEPLSNLLAFPLHSPLIVRVSRAR
jgi:hypothetical protein